MQHLKHSRRNRSTWLHSAAFPTLLAVAILIIMMLAGVPIPAQTGPVVSVADATAGDEDETLAGDDVLDTLTYEGVEPTEGLPDDPPAQPVEGPPAQPSANSPPVKNGPLPARVDNSANRFFPPVIAQRGGSCAQAAGIHYTFTYEMDLARNLDARLLQNEYPDHWTWNCLNNASGGGSNPRSGWQIVKEVGIPSLDMYGDKFGLHSNYGWPSGYEKYYAAMKNRVDSFGSIPTNTPADLERVKRYLYNHNDASQQYGGVMNFSLLSRGRKTVKIPQGRYEAGKSLVISWGTTGGHSMTYVGYDDNVGYDVNGDGKITNDVDINGDGKVNLADWERGAFIWVDSHGGRPGDNGKGYSLYRLSTLSREKGGSSAASWVKVKKDYQPRATMMLRFTFDDRSKLRLTAGFASSPDASRPARTFEPGIYNGKFRVGSVPMRGKGNNEPIEIGLDLTDIVTNAQNGKFFLNLSRASSSQAKGELLAACIHRYGPDGKVTATHSFSIADGKFGEKPLELSLVEKK